MRLPRGYCYRDWCGPGRSYYLHSGGSLKPVRWTALRCRLRFRTRRREKYDALLPELLLCEEFAARALDPQVAWEAITEVVAAGFP